MQECKKKAQAVLSENSFGSERGSERLSKSELLKEVQQAIKDAWGEEAINKMMGDLISSERERREEKDALCHELALAFRDSY